MAACASLDRVANAAMTPGVICLPCGRRQISCCMISVGVLIYPSSVSCEQVTVSVRVVTMDCRDTICPSTLVILSAKPSYYGSPRCHFCWRFGYLLGIDSHNHIGLGRCSKTKPSGGLGIGCIWHCRYR